MKEKARESGHGLMDFALALPIHLPIKCLFCMNQREAEYDDSINYDGCLRIHF